MKLGILVETEEGLDWDHWRDTVSAAERLGFESIWISDHLESPWSAERRGLEPWTALAVAVAQTRRIVSGSLVSPVTFREPAIVARMAASLAELSQGRFIVGLGLGWNAEEHARAGIAFPATADRSRRLVETIKRVRAELGERRIPILVGGKGPRSTLPIVARYADEWNMTASSPEDYVTIAGELDRLCHALGRDPRDIRRSVAVGVLVGRDATDLSQRCERMRTMVKPLADADDAAETARRMGWMVGTPEEILKGVRAFEDAGVERVIFGHYDLDDLAALEVLAGLQ